MSMVSKRDYPLLLFGDVLLFSVSLWLTLLVRYLSLPGHDKLIDHFVPFSFLFGVWVFVYFLAGLYDRHTSIFRGRLPERILYAQAINIVLAALFFFLIPYFEITPKTNLAIYLVISSVLIFIWRTQIFPRLPLLRRSDAILIGTGPDAAELADEFKRSDNLLAFVDVLDTASLTPAEVEARVHRAVERANGISTIVGDTTDPVMIAALPALYDVAFSARRLAFADLGQLYQDVFERVPLSNVRYDWILSNLGRPFLYDTLKRVIDIAGGVVGCVVLLVVFPFAALAIRLDDDGPVLISQERVGRYRQAIHILKFRSMSGSDRGAEALKTKQKVTRVGRLMRKVHLDELPQFWNVLKGDLSLVGPRPELPALVEHYEERIPYYQARHLVKPGLTGWARLRHRLDPHHGTDVAETTNKLAYDLYYLKYRSLVFDIYIIFQTIKLVLMARGE